MYAILIEGSIQDEQSVGSYFQKEVCYVSWMFFSGGMESRGRQMFSVCPTVPQTPAFNVNLPLHCYAVCGCCQTRCTEVETHGQKGKRELKEIFGVRPLELSKCLTFIGSYQVKCLEGFRSQ